MNEVQYARHEEEAHAVPAWVVLWDNGIDSGRLPSPDGTGMFDSEAEAEAAGSRWHGEMVAADENPEDAALEYSFDVMEGWCVAGDFVPNDGNNDPNYGPEDLLP